MKVTPFSQKVYDALCLVPKGKVTTYKLLAQAIGTQAYRAVGTALAHNPFAPQVPCHRVIASDGTLGGFMGSKSHHTLGQKKSLLIQEGITLEGNRVKNFAHLLHTFA